MSPTPCVKDRGLEVPESATGENPNKVRKVFQQNVESLHQARMRREWLRARESGYPNLPEKLYPYQAGILIFIHVLMSMLINILFLIKGTVPQSIFFLKGGHHGAIYPWNNSDFLHLKLCLCPAKLLINVDFAPQNDGAMQTLPRKITETSFFAPQNDGAMQYLFCKIVET